MSPLSIAALSLSMSADAFAASLGKGAAMRPTLGRALRAGLVFGIIEAITPLIGWSLGRVAADYVGAVDHWIAFGLLAIVGGKLIFDALHPARDDAPEGAENGKRVGLIALMATAVGTSIDAAAVGVSLALIGVNILAIAASIGLATFTMTTIGMLIGRAAGARYGRVMEVIGGLILIWIGSFILCQHLGLLG